MTDNEIMKSVELCLANDIIQSNCEKCKYKDDDAMCMVNMFKDILDLIKRQKAEIERLQKENRQFDDIGKMYSEIKSETRKEVLEKVKDKFLPIASALFGIGETLVNASKSHISSDEALSIIRSYLSQTNSVSSRLKLEQTLDNLLEEMESSQNV